MLEETQRLQALEEMDEDDSDGEESDDEIGVSYFKSSKIELNIM